MELNALNRWQSVGKELYLQGDLNTELSKLETIVARSDADDEAKRNSEHQPKILTYNRNALTRANIWHFVKLGLRRFAKGFTFGYSVFSTINLIRILLDLYNKRLHSVSGVFKRFLQLLTNKYSLSMASFLGLFLTLFESTMRVSRYLRGTSTDQLLSKVRYRTILAGSLAGTALLAVPADSRVGISVFFAVRALEIMAKHAGETQMFPEFITNFQYYDVLTMMLASVQVCYAAMYSRKSMVPSYKVFMDRQSGQALVQRSAYGDLCTLQSITAPTLAKLNTLRGKTGLTALAATLPGNANLLMPQIRTRQQLACEIMHPHEKTCLKAAGVYWLKAVMRALPVYVPVYVLPLLLFRLKKLLADPINTLVKTVSGIARSTAFLASYCMAGWASVCFFRHYVHGDVARWHVFFSGACAGSMVAIEAPSRRLELALYVMGQALQSFYSTFRIRGRMPYVKHGEVAIFVLSMAVIMHAYINKPRLMRSSYFAAFRFFFGSGGVKEGFPQADHARAHKKKLAQKIKSVQQQEP